MKKSSTGTAERSQRTSKKALDHTAGHKGAVGAAWAQERARRIETTKAKQATPRTIIFAPLESSENNTKGLNSRKHVSCNRPVTNHARINLGKFYCFVLFRFSFYSSPRFVELSIDGGAAPRRPFAVGGGATSAPTGQGTRPWTFISWVFIYYFKKMVGGSLCAEAAGGPQGRGF